MLERVFLIEELRPWHANRKSRLVKTPKLHLGDTGLACVLLGLDAAALGKDRTSLGPLLETFVFQEFANILICSLSGMDVRIAPDLKLQA